MRSAARLEPHLPRLHGSWLRETPPAPASANIARTTPQRPLIPPFALPRRVSVLRAPDRWSESSAPCCCVPRCLSLSSARWMLPLFFLSFAQHYARIHGFNTSRDGTVFHYHCGGEPEYHFR